MVAFATGSVSAGVAMLVAMTRVFFAYPRVVGAIPARRAGCLALVPARTSSYRVLSSKSHVALQARGETTSRLCSTRVLLIAHVLRMIATRGLTGLVDGAPATSN